MVHFFVCFCSEYCNTGTRPVDIWQDNICHNHKYCTELYRNASQIYGNLAYSWEMPRVVAAEGMDKDITGIAFYHWCLFYILCIWNYTYRCYSRGNKSSDFRKLFCNKDKILNMLGAERINLKIRPIKAASTL